MNFRDWLNQNRSLAPGIADLAAVPGTWTTAEELHPHIHRDGADSPACDSLAMFKDHWLAMANVWEHDCADCRTDSTEERYMVNDDVWAAAGMCMFGFLCIGCLEERLGRRLTAADFIDVPLNHAPGFRRSARLTARLASSGGPSSTARTYLLAGAEVTVTAMPNTRRADLPPAPAWLHWQAPPKGAPRNCAVRHGDGATTVRPFRGLRKSPITKENQS